MSCRLSNTTGSSAATTARVGWARCSVTFTFEFATFVQVLSRSAVATGVAQEVLRLLVPVRSVFRRAACNTAVGGVAVPAGTNCIINLSEVRLRVSDKQMWM